MRRTAWALRPVPPHSPPSLVFEKVLLKKPKNDADLSPACRVAALEKFGYVQTLLTMVLQKARALEPKPSGEPICAKTVVLSSSGFALQQRVIVGTQDSVRQHTDGIEWNT